MNIKLVLAAILIAIQGYALLWASSKLLLTLFGGR